MFGIHSLYRKTLGTLAVGAGLAFAPMAANASTITAADLPSGISFVDLGFATATGSNLFAHKTIAGYDVVGISGGYEGGEIDLSGEFMTIQYAESQKVSTLDLGLLFAALEEDDVYNEVAKVIVYGADNQVLEYTLSVVDGTTAIWSGPGTVTNLSPATFGNAAVWSIANPFGDLAVTGFRLEATGPADPANYRNNDYGLVSVTTTPVPEPGTLAMMGFGLAGLALSGRKRRS